MGLLVHILFHVKSFSSCSLIFSYIVVLRALTPEKLDLLSEYTTDNLPLLEINLRRNWIYINSVLHEVTTFKCTSLDTAQVYNTIHAFILFQKKRGPRKSILMTLKSRYF